MVTRPLGPTLAAAIAVFGCAAAVWVVVPAARADFAIIQTRWQIDQWASGKAPAPGIVAWGKARTAVAHALSITPNDPQLHEHMAYLYASRAQQASVLAPDLANSLMAQALLSYRQAVALRPMSGVLWANVAQASHSLQPNPSAAPSHPEAEPPLLWQAFDKAIAYGQREPAVQQALTHVGFARWDELSPARRTALLAMAALAAPHAQPALAEIAQRHGRQHLLPAPPLGAPPAAD